jgi:hypothetical protein
MEARVMFRDVQVAGRTIYRICVFKLCMLICILTASFDVLLSQALHIHIHSLLCIHIRLKACVLFVVIDRLHSHLSLLCLT